MQVVIDAKMFVSAAIQRGASHRIVMSWLAGAAEFELVTCPALLAEVREVVTARPRLRRWITLNDATQFVDAVATLVDLVDDPGPISAETRDHGNGSFVALARGHNVDASVWSWACDNGFVPAAGIEVGGRAIDVARLEDICTRFGIAELSVFGSVARGDATPLSDVDLLYRLRPGARVGFVIDDLEDELAKVFGRRVDLVARKALHPMLRPTIEEQALILYAA